jgi:SAM-dependent methyltransferase
MMKVLSRIAAPLRSIPKGVRAKSATVFVPPSAMFPAASVGLCNDNGAKGAIGDIHHRSLDPDEDKKKIYKMWVDTYDADVASEEYAGPAHVAKAVTAGLSLEQKLKPLAILDAGCGTGLVGEELFKLLGKGAHITVEGADISTDMLDLAKGRGYTDTHQIDLNKPMKFPSHSFDAIACSGTFLQGHVGSDPAIPEFCRIVRPGGQVVATVRMSFYDDAFEATLDRLKNDGHHVEVSEFQYLRGVSAFLLKITTSKEV